jgi:hypothetical protein
MAGFKGGLYSERASASADAKKALLEKFKAKPPADSPEMLARAAERRAIAEARELRVAEQARVAEEEARAVEKAARDEQLKAERKAARDARYAARKARR